MATRIASDAREILFRYLGDRTDGFCVVGRGTGALYKVRAPGVVVRVDSRDQADFPRKYFKEVQPPDPESVEPLNKPMVVDQSDSKTEPTKQVPRRRRKKKTVKLMSPDDYLDVLND